MALTMDDCKCKLINKILFASSQDEVKRYIDITMKGLQQNKVNGHIIARFIDKMLLHLEEFNAVYRNSQQWSNIKMARKQFNQLKRSLQAEHP